MPSRARRLTAEGEALGASLAAVAREKREGEATLAATLGALADYDRAFSRANALAALYRLADADDLADRVRPSGRRPGRTAETDEAAAANEGR